MDLNGFSASRSLTAVMAAPVSGRAGFLSSAIRASFCVFNSSAQDGISAGAGVTCVSAIVVFLSVFGGVGAVSASAVGCPAMPLRNALREITLLRYSTGVGVTLASRPSGQEII